MDFVKQPVVPKFCFELAEIIYVEACRNSFDLPDKVLNIRHFPALKFERMQFLHICHIAAASFDAEPICKDGEQHSPSCRVADFDAPFLIGRKCLCTWHAGFEIVGVP